MKNLSEHLVGLALDGVKVVCPTLVILEMSGMHQSPDKQETIVGYLACFGLVEAITISGRLGADSYVTDVAFPNDNQKRLSAPYRLTFTNGSISIVAGTHSVVLVK
jgi:hypothetical protein